MCGRYTFTEKDSKKIKERFHLVKITKGVQPSYNIAPTQNVAAILNESPQEISLVRWGLIPSWAKEENTKYSMINAKAETILDKPAYRGPIRHKRCLIPADSFYEWQKTDDGKHPYRILMKNEGMFAFAGIWDRWEKGGKHIDTCAIITIAPNALCKRIHDRMPAILPRECEEEWLSDIDVKRAVALLKSYPAKDMKTYEVSTAINSPKNNSVENLEPVSVN